MCLCDQHELLLACRAHSVQACSPATKAAAATIPSTSYIARARIIERVMRDRVDYNLLLKLLFPENMVHKVRMYSKDLVPVDFCHLIIVDLGYLLRGLLEHGDVQPELWDTVGLLMVIERTLHWCKALCVYKNISIGNEVRQYCVETAFKHVVVTVPVVISSHLPLIYLWQHQPPNHDLLSITYTKTMAELLCEPHLAEHLNKAQMVHVIDAEGMDCSLRVCFTVVRIGTNLVGTVYRDIINIGGLMTRVGDPVLIVLTNLQGIINDLLAPHFGKKG